MRIPTGFLTLFILASTVFFPWLVTGIITVLLAPWEPLLPLAVGMVFDALYSAPGAHAFPVFSLYGAVLTAGAFFVRERLRASILR
jgi:hypothetical protein